jgi:hypothetical protein
MMISLSSQGTRRCTNDNREVTRGGEAHGGGEGERGRCEGSPSPQNFYTARSFPPILLLARLLAPPPHGEECRLLKNA